VVGNVRPNMVWRDADMSEVQNGTRLGTPLTHPDVSQLYWGAQSERKLDRPGHV
jgi:hypothetical protein